MSFARWRSSIISTNNIYVEVKYFRLTLSVQTCTNCKCILKRTLYFYRPFINDHTRSWKRSLSIALHKYQILKEKASSLEEISFRRWGSLIEFYRVHHSKDSTFGKNRKMVAENTEMIWKETLGENALWTLPQIMPT